MSVFSDIDLTFLFYVIFQACVWVYNLKTKLLDKYENKLRKLLYTYTVNAWKWLRTLNE